MGVIGASRNAGFEFDGGWAVAGIGPISKHFDVRLDYEMLEPVSPVLSAMCLLPLAKT
jgi:hypothetical protein